MIVRELAALLGFKYDDRQAKKFDRQMDTLKKGAVALGVTLSAGVLGRAVTQFLDQQTMLADRIDKASSKLGISTEALQEYHHAAAISGVNTQTFDMALQRFTRRSAEAAAGTGEAKDAIKELGLDAQALARATPEDAMMMVAAAMGQVERQSDRVRLAFKLFDSEGVSVVNMLQNGADGLAALREEARELGGVMSSELIESSVRYRDQITRLDQAWQGLRNRLAESVLPPILWLIETVTTGIKTFSNFSKGTRITEFALGNLAAAAIALAGAFLLPYLPVIALGVGIAALAALIVLVQEDIFNFMMGNDSLLGLIIDKAKELKGRFEDWMASLKSDNPVLQGFILALRFLYSIMISIGEIFEQLISNAGKLGGVLIAAVSGAATGDFGPLKAGLADLADSNLDFFREKIQKPFEDLPKNLGAVANEFLFGPQSIPVAAARGNANAGNTTTVNAPVTINGSGLDEDQLRRAVSDGIQEAANGVAAQTAGAQ